jgi:23S rRNA (uracil1939-C5)-methyltransferase
LSLASIEIGSLAAGGDGVGRHDGLVVFTPRTAPGDRVLVEVDVQGRIGRGVFKKLERAGAVRIASSCHHYEAPDRCGGCQWQHVDITAQRDAKRAMVRDAFQRIAKRDVALPSIVAGEEWRYRRSLTLAMRRGSEGTFTAGMRAYDDPGAVFELEDCLITDAAVLEAWREVLAAAEHFPREGRLRGTVRVINGHAYFTLEGGKDWGTLSAFLGAVPGVSAVWWHAEGKRRRLVADRRPAGEPGASFAQVNPEVAALMQAAVVDLAMEHAPKRVIDAFSGSGDTAAALARLGATVIAIEADEEATAYAATRLAEPSRAIAARVEAVIGVHLPADVVILNPPRAGVDAKVMTAISKAPRPPKAIIYVSCDPATLARDVARLEGWRVHSLECYDLFPQTSHVETVCELRPENP